MINENDFYRTSDLSLAAVISASYVVEAIDKTNPRKAYWIFKRDGQLDELLTQYYRRELRVDPVAFFEQLSFIKSRLYSQD